MQEFDKTYFRVFLKMFFIFPCLSQDLLSLQDDPSLDTSALINQCYFLISRRVFEDDVVSEILFEGIPAYTLFEPHLLPHLFRQGLFISQNKLHYFLADSQVPYDV